MSNRREFFKTLTAMLEEKISLARSFEVMNEAYRKKLIEDMREIAEKGKFEDYKYGNY